MAHAEKCPVCNGAGRIPAERYYDKPCHGCSGKGWVEVSDAEDSQLVLMGEGDEE